jgi:TolA-binding protein
LKKELRKSIKQDEFVSWIERTMGLVDSHKDEIRVTVIALAVVGALVGGLAFLKSQRTQEARAAFTDAVTTFETPVAGAVPGGPAANPGPTFATSEEKFKKAVASFEGVARRYPSDPVASRARYFAAVSRIEMGETAEAQKELEALVADKDAKDLTRSLAKMSLADLLRRGQKLEQAAEAYRQLVTDPTLAIPRDYPLWSLAQTLEEAGRTAEAAVEYRRLRDEFPTSQWAQEAGRNASFLAGSRDEG